MFLFKTLVYDQIPAILKTFSLQAVVFNANKQILAG